MASGPITSWQIDGETVADFISLGSKITADGDCSHEIKRHLLLGSQSLKGGITFYALEVLTANTMLWQKGWFFQGSCMDVRVGQ